MAIILQATSVHHLPRSFVFMELKSQTIKELKQIVEKDYGVLLSDEEAQEFGISILKLTRLGLTAIARADEAKNSSVVARAENVLEPKTSG